ncbi:MAG: hypothetical protein EOP38_05225 [Rubrivivax sp.]|nr:MAG: hypothetical protein EOP38_05225 [Rubrivivax sp.]
MSTSHMNDPAAQDDNQARAQPARRPYIKPAFQHESVFETMALACGKTGPISESCMAQSSAS